MRIVVSLLALHVSGCASLASPDIAAVLIDSSEATQSELRRVVASALSRDDVLLANDALTRESVLSIGRAPARDAAGRRITGRDLEKPETFRLLLRGGQCVLVHERTGEAYKLEHARCGPVG